MGTPERRVNMREQISALKSCTLKSNDWVRQFIAKKFWLDQGETTELFEALWHARHVISGIYCIS